MSRLATLPSATRVDRVACAREGGDVIAVALEPPVHVDLWSALAIYADGHDVVVEFAHATFRYAMPDEQSTHDGVTTFCRISALRP